MKYTHIFFDLDHTLWDYDANALKVLIDLYHHFELRNYISINPTEFAQIFFTTNDGLWAKYNVGEITRSEIRNGRFKIVMEACGSDATLDFVGMNDYFLYHCPRQTGIMEGADIILPYLSKKYPLSIITNGFDDVQYVKLDAVGFSKFFKYVFTSETTGHKKPSREIFEYALEKAQTTPDKCVMIGDNPSTDILGAVNAGITPVLYNPTGKVKSECQLQVQHLTELMKLL